MSIEADIKKLILLDKKNILKEIELLKQELGLEKKIDSLVSFIDDMDSIYLTNLDVHAKNLDEQIKINQNKALEMRCYVKGEKKYIKSFGAIGQLNQNEFTSIIKFLNLIKLLKSINEASFYASQYYSADKMVTDLESID